MHFSAVSDVKESVSRLGDARPFSRTCPDPVSTVSADRKPPSALAKLANSSKADAQAAASDASSTHVN